MPRRKIPKLLSATILAGCRVPHPLTSKGAVRDLPFPASVIRQFVNIFPS